jgi:hypothetical protein
MIAVDLDELLFLVHLDGLLHSGFLLVNQIEFSVVVLVDGVRAEGGELLASGV